MWDSITRILIVHVSMYVCLGSARVGVVIISLNHFLLFCPKDGIYCVRGLLTVQGMKSLCNDYRGY